MTEIDVMNAEDIFNFILKNNYIEIFSNIMTVLKLLFTLPVTVASAERSFSKLKLIKNYLRSTMSTDRLNLLAILSIEKETVEECDFCNIINEMAIKKAHFK